MGRIFGERVTLREFRWEDLADIRTWVTDGPTARAMGQVFMKPRTWEQTEQYLRNLLEGGSGADFVIADRETLKYMGQCNLMLVDSVARKAEIGIVLLPEFAGQGYGEEALKLLTGFAFDQMNLNRIHLKVYADNLRAIRLYEKLGFRHEGRLREDCYRDGGYEDALLMGLLRSEWRPAQGRA